MNQTIYFRKNVWDSLKDETDKSKLINTLLEKHYAREIHTIEFVKGADIAEELNPFRKVEPTPVRLASGVCKIHGTPLDGRGKCLQKGCKNG